MSMLTLKICRMNVGKTMDVNLNSMVLVTNAVGEVFRKQQSGVIVNTSSMSGVIVNTPQAAYNTSKQLLSC